MDDIPKDTDLLETLRQSEQRFRRAIMDAPFPCMIHNEQGQVELINSAWTELSGYLHQQIPTIADWATLAFGERKQIVQDEFQALHTMNHKIQQGEYLIRTESNEIRVWDFQSTPLGTSPEGYHLVLSMATDVTDRSHEHQQLTEHAADLTTSNDALQQFAYIASHDLQEPLRMITGYLQLLQRRYSDQLDERANRFIGYATDGALRMHQLINDLLAYSRIETRGNEFEAVELENVLSSTIRNLKTVVQESGAQITHSALPIVKADPSQIGQLFQNLISNALKFRSQATPQIHIDAELKDAVWTIKVHDNGIGIDPQYHEQIFEMLRRLHTHDEYPGTGIGLAICGKIVERHGGHIWVQSRLGAGSTFCFTLPAIEEIP